jgi:hypothetical protein
MSTELEWGWRAALEAKLELRRYYDTHDGQRYIEGFAEDRINKYGDPLMRHLLSSEQATLDHAEPVWVSEDFMTLIDAAAPGFGDEEFLATDLFAPGAFVLLPRPVLDTDAHGEVVSVRAFGWIPFLFMGVDEEGVRVGDRYVARPPTGQLTRRDTRLAVVLNPENIGDWSEEWQADGGVYLALYTHEDDPSGADDKHQEEYGGRIRDFAAAQRATGRVVPKLSLLHSGTQSFRNGEAISEIDRWFRTMLRLASQTIVVPERMQAPRALRREGERRDVRADRVTVMRLRRPRQTATVGGGTWQLTKRHIVHGFWRNQWYPSIESHRQRWIADYVKGPEDGELVIPSHRAWEISR